MSGIVDTITSVLGTLLYPLFSIIFVLVDGIQGVFFAFAGIGNISYDGKPITSGNSGVDTDTGIVYYLMNNQIVKNLIMSIMLLALFLIIIFTVMAFIKNAYAAKQKGWKEIIGNSIKGLANFIFIPVCCLLGVWLGNILLQAINGATSSNSATSMSRKLFIACAYNANLYRLEGNLRPGDDDNGAVARSAYIEAYGVTEDEAKTAIPEGLTHEQYAQIVDDLYVKSENNNLNIHWYWKVGSHYSLWQINYLVLIVGGIFMLYVLGSLAFAMVRRLFLIIVLFIISPGVCAMFPIDEGKAVGSWKGEFIKQVLSAYGAVAGLNIFFSLMPLVDRIELYSGIKGFGLNEIIQIFILVTGLLVVKEIIALISGFVGGEDAYNKGSSLMKGAAKEVGGRANKAFKNTVGAFSRASGALKNGGVKAGLKSFFVDSIGKGLLNTGNNAIKTLSGGALDIKDLNDTRKKSYYQGIEAGEKFGKVRKEGKYGEKAARDKTDKYYTSTSSDRRASVMFDKMNDDMKKIVFDKTKDLSYVTNLGMKDKKQEEAVKDMKVIDNFIELFDRINDNARDAATAWASVSTLRTSMTGAQKKIFDEALESGKTLKDGDAGLTGTDLSNFNDYITKANATKTSQDRFNQYAENHSDEVNGNKVVLSMVEKVQSNITTQQNSGVYSEIDDTVTGIRDLKTNTIILATAFRNAAQDTKENAKKAKYNKEKEDANKKS